MATASLLVVLNAMTLPVLVAVDHASQPLPHVLLGDNANAAVRVANRLRGGVLVLRIRPGMSEQQVWASLGAPSLVTGGAGGFACSYPKFGVTLRWSGPSWFMAPSERIGPGGMLAIGSLPSRWVRLVALPLLSQTYAPPSVIRGVDWCGIPVYRSRR